MGKIIRNGEIYAGNSTFTFNSLAAAQAALQAGELPEYADVQIIPLDGEGNAQPFPAELVGYDNSESGLDAENVQGAVDEISEKKSDTDIIGNVETIGEVSEHTYSAGSYFIGVNNDGEQGFYLATDTITANTTTITVGTNCSKTGIGSALSTLNSNLANIPYFKTGSYTLTYTGTAIAEYTIPFGVTFKRSPLVLVTPATPSTTFGISEISIFSVTLSDFKVAWRSDYSAGYQTYLNWLAIEQ